GEDRVHPHHPHRPGREDHEDALRHRGRRGAHPGGDRPGLQGFPGANPPDREKGLEASETSHPQSGAGRFSGVTPGGQPSVAAPPTDPVEDLLMAAVTPERLAEVKDRLLERKKNLWLEVKDQLKSSIGDGYQEML